MKLLRATAASSRLAIALTALALSAPLFAQQDLALKIAPIFGDHMVVQQEKPVPVWGTASPGAAVGVKFDGQTVKATADADGKWKLDLAPMKAKPVAEQQPQVMTISDGRTTVEVRDVLLGEVWLGSGQSNMNREISEKDASALAPMPGLRIRATVDGPWVSLDQDAKGLKGFSTLLFPFGQRLSEEIKVPIGLMVSAVGGTASGRWAPKDAGADAEVLRMAALYQQRFPAMQKQYDDDEATMEKETADWYAALLPYLRKYEPLMVAPDAKGKPNPSAEKWKASGVDLSKIATLGALTKDQRKLLNSVLGSFIKTYDGKPEVAEGLAIVDDFMRARHPAWLDLKPFWLSWQYGWGVEPALPLQPEKPAAPKAPPTAAGDLFQKHVEPLIPFAIRGIVWDQGESGTGWPGIDQFTLMSALIKGWRARWSDDLPWIYVQKPSGEGCRLVYDAKDQARPFQAQLPEFLPDPNWGLFREIHTRIMALPKTTMVATSDLAPGIHPPDKNRYGRRAADVALNKVYGRPVQALGPIYQSHAVSGDRMRITFREAGKGLVAAHAESPQGFMVAGADRKFVWANARIISPDTVEVWSDAVKAPDAVRYAYAYAIPWANLFNQDGLPAATFRTDDWTWEGENPTWLVKLYAASLRRTNWVWEPAPKPPGGH